MVWELRSVIKGSIVLIYVGKILTFNYFRKNEFFALFPSNVSRMEYLIEDPI